MHTFRGIGAFRFVKVQIRAAAPTRILGYRNVLNDAWSNHASHRMFGTNTLVCRRNVAIGRERIGARRGHAQRRGNTSTRSCYRVVSFYSSSRTAPPFMYTIISLDLHGVPKNECRCPRCIDRDCSLSLVNDDPLFKIPRGRVNATI